MTDQTPNQPDPTEPVAVDRPLATSDAAVAPARRGFTLRGRKWMYGATLAAAGVLAGGGVTYAVVSANPTVQTQAFQQSGAGTRGGGPMTGGGPGGQQGTAPDGSAPGGQAPDSQPTAEPSTSGDGTI